MTGSNRFLIISNIIKHRVYIYIYPIYCQNRIIILHMIPKCIIFQIILHQSPSWATLSWGPVIRKAWQPLVPFVARRGSCGPWSPAGICGKSMGNLWEICGKSMGNLWEIHGKTWFLPVLTSVYHHSEGFPADLWSNPRHFGLQNGWPKSLLQQQHYSLPNNTRSETYTKLP